jgi:hypothetical protein
MARKVIARAYVPGFHRLKRPFTLESERTVRARAFSVRRQNADSVRDLAGGKGMFGAANTPGVL